jgi:CheY-like chemotaxis protein
VSPAHARRYERPLEGILILVVEDHADSAEFLREFLESRGAKVRLAGDGIEALKSLKSRIPDIVLTDIRMPRMDGVQLAHQMKRHVQWARVPISAVTAYNSPADLRATLEAGFDGHLEKPINVDGLLNTVTRLVMRSRARHRLRRPR